MSLQSAPPGLAAWLYRLEGFGRAYRWWFAPGRYLAYRRLVREAPTRPSGARPVVLFDLKDSRIDGPQGRRFYALFILFLRAGYEPAFRKSYLFLATTGSRTKRLCFRERYSILNGDDPLPEGSVVVTDRARPRPAAGVVKTISIDFRAGYEEDGEGFPLPFSMFPEIYAEGGDLRARTLRASERPWRIFFGGDARPEKYTKSSTPTVYRKLPRSRVLEVLRVHLGPSRWSEPASESEWAAALDGAWPGALILNTRQLRVHPRDWLPTVARAAFFLACPGVRYPMSHNVIEAMAVGTVPIVEYPELFFPHLEDGVNCLAFQGESGLRATADRALAMSAEEVRRLSEGAASYYDRHLDPVAVVGKLLAEPGPTVSLRLLPFLRPGGGHA